MTQSVGVNTETSFAVLMRAAGYLAPILLLSLLQGGCSPEPTSKAPVSQRAKNSSSTGEVLPADHEPIVRAARIYPSDVSLLSTLRVDIRGEDPAGRALTYKYQWIVNDIPVSGASDPQFSLHDLKNRDRVEVEVIPTVEGFDGRSFKSPPVIVGSTVPEITEIRLEPMPIHRGQTLSAKVVARHPDGEPVKLAFKWFRNGKEVPGAISDTLETKAFRKKDILAVLVTPSDAKVSGEPKGSAALTIENGPPGITSLPPTVVEDGQYRYQVIAIDPDEDVVRYELKEGPVGMSIEPVTGKVVWKLTMDSKGKHRVVIVAKDPDNASTEQDFVLEGETPTAPSVVPTVPVPVTE